MVAQVYGETIEKENKRLDVREMQQNLSESP